MLAYYRELIALKRSGALGPRRRERVTVDGDEATRLITVRTPHTLTVLNFADAPRDFAAPAGWTLRLASDEPAAEAVLAPFAARIWVKNADA